MIPAQLLAATEGRAPAIVVYGAAGMKKTLFIHTLPPPILCASFEGGTGCLLPWLRRRREWNRAEWQCFSQEQREAAATLVNPEKTGGYKALLPAPLVDVVEFDTTEPEAYTALVQLLGNLASSTEYNSVAFDAMHEWAVLTQTYTKGMSGASPDTLMEVKYWGPAQERAAILLRKLRNLRSLGVFVYLSASEDIAKDYVKDPREAKGGLPQEPYSVRGTVNVPGKLVQALQHLPDILCHAELRTGHVVFTTEPTPLPGGVAWWDAKDRYGRLAKHEPPNFWNFAKALFGKEGALALYNYCKEAVNNEQ